METRYSLRPGTALVDFDEKTALFYRFGNRVFINGLPENFKTEEFFDFLRTPQSFDKIQSFLRQSTSIEPQTFLDQLKSQGLLQIEDSKSNDIPADSPWNHYIKKFFSSTSEQADALKVLQTTSIKLLCLEKNSSAYVDSFKRLFGNFSLIQDLDQIQDNDFVIVQGSWTQVLKIQRLNKQLLKKKTKWLLCLNDEHGGAIGPHFGFKDGPCFNCMIERRNLNINHHEKQNVMESYFDRHAQGVRLCELPNVHETLAEILSVEIFKIVTGAVGSKINHGLYEFDFLNHRRAFHELLALPYCDVCSEYDKMPSQILETPFE